MVTRRKNISQKAPIVGSQFYVYDLDRLIFGSIHFKSMMINFRQPKSSSSHMRGFSVFLRSPLSGFKVFFRPPSEDLVCFSFPPFQDLVCSSVPIFQNLERS